MAKIPEKAFYKVSEVCQYTDTQPYVLRFWESEFPQLVPRKNRAGQRIYTREDLELILRIKKLLHDEEYTIAAARRRLEEELGSARATETGRRDGRRGSAREEDTGEASRLAVRGAGESVADFLPEASPPARKTVPGDPTPSPGDRGVTAEPAGETRLGERPLRAAELIERAISSLLRPFELSPDESPSPRA
jgi:DNA-binding transcriptional MerR regulator